MHEENFGYFGLIVVLLFLTFIAASADPEKVQRMSPHRQEKPLDFFDPSTYDLTVPFTP